MNKLLSLLMLLVFFSACKSDKEKSNEKFVALVESADINSFLNIEYFQSGETETYNSYKGDTIFASWDYDNLTGSFEKYDTLKIKKISTFSSKYMEELRNKIKSLNVKLISQTQWHSQVIKFWTGDAEYFTYVHPDFKFDSSEKSLLESELKNSDKINDNWYYKKMKVCTNK